MTRGLVISSPLEHSSGRLLIKSNHLDPQELRFSLLFWDRLDHPDNNLISLRSSPDAEFLIKAGVLTRTRIQVRGAGSLEDGFRFAHITAFRELDKREPGVWSLATGERSISFLDSELEQGRGALVRLHRAIPVPDQDVHLQDILDFKQKRQAELLKLRHHLELIYGRVSDAVDGKLALQSEVEALNIAISEYIKSTRGFKISWRLASVEASINASGAAMAGWAAFQMGLPATDAALVGAAASISIKSGFGLSRGMKTEKPYRYVSSYHRELFPSV
jgi:hypothetical protein